MSAIKDGGPAYPYTQSNGCNDGAPGLSLRDHFASHALTGLLHFWALTCSKTGEIRDPKADVMAEIAYELADAMLAQREAGV